MGTPWDRAADRYITNWVPRFVPYHLDLVRELSLAAGQRVFVASSGPGSEVLAVARAVGERGCVRATDMNPEMVKICSAQLEKAGFSWATCEAAAPHEVGDGIWHAVVCAFGVWAFPDRALVLKSWAGALAPKGKVGLLTFGPPDDQDPFEMLNRALAELEPDAVTKPPRIEADREAMARMFDDAGLSLVRHRTLRHLVSFPSAEEFTDAIREGRTWRRVWEELGPTRVARVTARFYDMVGGPTAPLAFEPAVTLAIAALPGAEVELATLPHGIRAPTRSSAPPPSKLPRGDD